MIIVLVIVIVVMVVTVMMIVVSTATIGIPVAKLLTTVILVGKLLGPQELDNNAPPTLRESRLLCSITDAKQPQLNFPLTFVYITYAAFRVGSWMSIFANLGGELYVYASLQVSPLKKAEGCRARIKIS